MFGSFVHERIAAIVPDYSNIDRFRELIPLRHIASFPYFVPDHPHLFHHCGEEVKHFVFGAFVHGKSRLVLYELHNPL